MNFNITTLLQAVDRFGQNYVAQAYQNLAAAMTGGGTGGVSVAGLLLTLYVIFWAYGMWAASAQGTATEAAFRLLRAFAVYTLATSWGDFQTLIYTALNEGPAAVGNALLTSASANTTGTAAGLNSVNAVQTALQNMWNTLAGTTSAFIRSLGVLNFGGYFLGLAVLIAGAILIGYAIFLIILAKLFMWLLLSLAPIFIVLMLFGYTTRFFSGWVSAIVQYVCVQILVYAFCAFFISVSQTYFDAVNQSNAALTTSLTEAAPLILICVVGILLISQITNVATLIAGGVGIGAPAIGRFTAMTARGAGIPVASRWAGRGILNLTGTMTPTERLTGRSRARTALATTRYEQSAEYQRLAKKLTETT